ncbi:FAD-dependent monooxygenase [Catenulispora sp. NL8]|uniref:FAD-dependent monooxygenase n=1 Tax=Catenulispora pinistramenti TaxID=2705254 RepID=A0ABS5KVQ4_9ACTN|nr:FAD-dependent monooxygenase [Catenulispora pinistramenti]MBS2550145.1 FAD-dependent monooxygenase [Catenulispora pinistramenti]
MRILIIGGGIAGSAAALALHKAGFEAAVYEAHPKNGEDLGAFLTLASNGMRSLGQLGAAEAVAGLGFPLTGLRLLDATGATLADTPLGGRDDPLTRFRCLRRADLAAALQQEVRRRGIPINHGARLSSLTEDAAGVTATFADGRTASGNLLIGADGLNSKVRSLISPAEPRYAGQKVFYGYTTEAPQAEDSEQITMIRGSATAFGAACSPTGQTYWFARVTSPRATADEIATMTSSQWRDHLLPLVEPDNTPAAAIIAATSDQLMVTNAVDLPLGLRWHTLRTLIIGDAAHAASPATGQGASMAMEDAVVLAKALRDAPSMSGALADYERVRRPRVEDNIAASAALSAGRPPARDGADSRPVALSDDELARQLEWRTPLPTR